MNFRIFRISSLCHTYRLVTDKSEFYFASVLEYGDFICGFHRNDGRAPDCLECRCRRIVTPHQTVCG